MVIFDTEIAFENDGTAVIGASGIDGSGIDARFALRITREYAEQTWRIRYSEVGVTTKFWVHMDEFRELVSRELARGRTELVL